jgi:RNA polymerase sigma-70 factor, ECF subfamily
MTDAVAVPDEVLVAQVLDGEIDAFAELVRRHQKRILRIGIGFFKNEEDAADFTQDVMLKAYTALGTFRGASKFSTWLTRIAYNAAINGTKRKPKYDPLESDPVDAKELAPEDRQIQEEAIAALRKAMDELPPKYAVCLDLYFYMGMKYGEISEVTGFPVNTIKSHVFRAKRELRKALDDEEVEI